MGGLRLMGGREEGAGEVEVGLGLVELGLDDMEERAKVLVVEEQSVQVKRACDIDEQHHATPLSPIFPLLTTNLSSRPKSPSTRHLPPPPPPTPPIFQSHVNKTTTRT